MNTHWNKIQSKQQPTRVTASWNKGLSVKPHECQETKQLMKGVGTAWEIFPYWLLSVLSQLENMFELIGNMIVEWFSTFEKKTKSRGNYQLQKYFNVRLRGCLGECWTCNNQRKVFVVGKEKVVNIRTPPTTTTKQADWPLEMVKSSAWVPTNGCLLLQNHQQCNHHHNASMSKS